MHLPNDVEMYMEECEEHGFLPGIEEFTDKFSPYYSESDIDTWIEFYELGELAQPLPEEDLEMVGAYTPFSYPEQERLMREAGLSILDFLEEVK